MLDSEVLLIGTFGHICGNGCISGGSGGGGISCGGAGSSGIVSARTRFSFSGSTVTVDVITGAEI